MHNLKKFNMNRKYRVRIRCLTFLVTLFWLPLHAQEAGKEFRPAGEPISYAEKDNRKKSPEPLEDQKDKLKKQHIITVKGRCRRTFDRCKCTDQRKRHRASDRS